MVEVSFPRRLAKKSTMPDRGQYGKASRDGVETASRPGFVSQGARKVSRKKQAGRQPPDPLGRCTPRVDHRLVGPPIATGHLHGGFKSSLRLAFL